MKRIYATLLQLLRGLAAACLILIIYVLLATKPVLMVAIMIAACAVVWCNIDRRLSSRRRRLLGESDRQDADQFDDATDRLQPKPTPVRDRQDADQFDDATDRLQPKPTPVQAPAATRVPPPTQAGAPRPTAEIEYVDSGGAQTVRRITVSKVKYSPDTGEVSVMAYCHLRDGQRTFLASRVVSWADLSSGEVIDDDVAEYLMRSHPGTRVDAALPTAANILNVLVWIARADGRLSKKEKEAIADIALAYTDELGPDDRTHVVERLKTWRPSEADFQASLADVATQPAAVRAAVVAASQAVVDTKKKPDELTLAVFDLVTRRLAGD